MTNLKLNPREVYLLKVLLLREQENTKGEFGNIEFANLLEKIMTQERDGVQWIK